MCGIAGLVRYDLDAATQQARVLRMRERLHHRGPDGAGLWSGAQAVLAHTRLSLLDADGGAQPMHSPDGRHVLVYNGEVYNVAELRQALAPRWEFRTRSDTEVVLAAWAAWGEACLPRLNGMFAFFVWDAREQCGYAARDLLGVKPFVYARQAGELLFASEAKALLPVLAQPPRADAEALVEYLAAPCFSGVERPMFAGLEYLPPGHLLRVGRDGLSLRRWGDYEQSADEAGPDVAAQLREALAGAVRRSLLADAPVGLFLSGGFDSTLIGALARGHGVASAAYTIRFEGQDSYDYGRSAIVAADDGPYAALAAEALRLECRDVAVRRAGLADDLQAIAAHNDALPAWEQELAQHHLARAASRTLKAVLVGDAADETHYGYHFLLDEDATRSPGAILRRLVGDPHLRPGLIDDAQAELDARYRSLCIAAGHGWDSAGARLRATSWLIRNRWLQRLLHNGDIHGMAHSLEARVPFADTALLALAARIPPELGLRGGVEKAALREAARGLVPEPVRLRRKSALPKDQGYGEALRGEAVHQLEVSSDLLAGLLDLPRLRRRCADPAPLQERERALLFRVVCLAHWARAHGVRMP